VTGCVYTPIVCDDGDLCTIDTCDPVMGCIYTEIICDDGDECTADSCDPATGECVYIPICEDCETAWAKPNNDGTTCFPGTGNWGWYVKIPAGTIAPGGVFDTSGDVWAGAAKCDTSKGTDVGEAYITLTANGIDVEFDLASDCHVTDLHVWASNDEPAGPGFNKWYKSGDITFNKALNLEKSIYVAVHTETCCLACDDKEFCTYG
jgi:hypothetical protein